MASSSHTAPPRVEVPPAPPMPAPRAPPSSSTTGTAYAAGPVHIKQTESTAPTGGEPPKYIPTEPYQPETAPLRTYPIDEPVLTTTQAPQSPVSTATTLSSSDPLLVEADRERQLAEAARVERQQAQTRMHSEKKFGDRVSAAGETFMKYMKEKKHESKADKLEQEEMSRKLHDEKLLRKQSRAATNPSQTTHHQDVRSNK